MGAFHNADATVAAHGARLITPNDTTVFPVTRSLYIGVAGNITVRMADAFNQGSADDNILFLNVPVGIMPIQVDKVYATGTAATGIVALY